MKFTPVNTLVLSMIMLFFFSCSDRLLTPASLNGEWELRHRRGGFVTPGTPENYPEGNGTRYSFTDGNFVHYQDGKPVESGTYVVVYEAAESNGEKLDQKIVFTSESGRTGLPIKLAGNSLQIHHGQIAADGVVLTYVRIR